MLIVILIVSCVAAVVLLCNKSDTKRTDNVMNFENAFKNRVGQDPVSYIAAKLDSGSELGSVRYLFDIMAAEVAAQCKCKSPGFDFYYSMVSVSRIRKEPEKTEKQAVVTKAFAASQLIGKERFLQSYGEMLKRLATNHEFLKFVEALQKELSGREVTDTRNANRRIADYFYLNKANEKFPEVQQIVKEVVTYGKQASAHISIYYAMYLYR